MIIYNKIYISCTIIKYLEITNMNKIRIDNDSDINGIMYIS